MERYIIKNSPENSGEGDKINVSFDKVNANFEYLFEKEYTGDSINIDILDLDVLQNGTLTEVITEIDRVLSISAVDADVVHKAGEEDITGKKNFLISPTVPYPLNNPDIASKEYVDDAANSHYININGVEFEFRKRLGNNNPLILEKNDIALNGWLDDNTLIETATYTGVGDPTLLTSWDIGVTRVVPLIPDVQTGTMIATWYVDTPNTNNRIELPLRSDGEYNFAVYDSNDMFLKNVISYADRFLDVPGVEADLYSIKMIGYLHQPLFANNKWLYSIESFGEGLIIDSLVGLFKNCINLTTIGNDLDTTSYTDFSNMFEGCTSFTSGAKYLDVSNATTLERMFYNNYPKNQKFNEDLSTWDVSNVRNMRDLFSNCGIFNQNINNWDVSNAENMSGIFSGCTAYNQPLNNWNTMSATSFSSMFYNAHLFNQDISGWNTSNVLSLGGMFQRALNFNSSLAGWDVSKVTNMNNLFNGANSFNQSLNTWTTTNVNNLSNAFNGATVYNQPMSNWDVSNVADTSASNMRFMFINAIKFDQDISMWCVENIPAKPTGFDDNSGFADVESKQPQWGNPC